MAQLTPEDLELRRTGIGSSEIAALCGESLYANAHSVWLDKLGLLEDRDNEAARWGRMLEPLVAQRYTEETGVQLRKGSVAMRHPDHQWALASPDYFEVTDDEDVVECKAAFRTAAQWSLDEDGAPTGYILQGNWQCGVLGRKRFRLAVFLAPFATFRIYRFDFDPEMFGHCLRIASKFWHEHVLTKVPPPADGSDAAKRALISAYPWRGNIVPAPEGSEEWFRRRLEADAAVEKAKAEQDLASNKLREAIGSADGIEGEGWSATWKPRRDGVRVLRVKEFTKKERAA